MEQQHILSAELAHIHTASLAVEPNGVLPRGASPRPAWAVSNIEEGGAEGHEMGIRVRDIAAEWSTAEFCRSRLMAVPLLAEVQVASVPDQTNRSQVRENERTEGLTMIARLVTCVPHDASFSRGHEHVLDKAPQYSWVDGAVLLSGQNPLVVWAFGHRGILHQNALSLELPLCLAKSQVEQPACRQGPPATEKSCTVAEYIRLTGELRRVTERRRVVFDQPLVIRLNDQIYSRKIPTR